MEWEEGWRGRPIVLRSAASLVTLVWSGGIQHVAEAMMIKEMAGVSMMPELATRGHRRLFAQAGFPRASLWTQENETEEKERSTKRAWGIGELDHYIQALLQAPFGVVGPTLLKGGHQKGDG